MPGVSAVASHGALPGGVAPEHDDRGFAKVLCDTSKDLGIFSLVWVTNPLAAR